MVHHRQADIQQQRILGFCREANPACMVEFKDCDMRQIKPVFHIPGSSPVYVEYAVSTNYPRLVSG